MVSTRLGLRVGAGGWRFAKFLIEAVQERT